METAWSSQFLGEAAGLTPNREEESRQARRGHLRSLGSGVLRTASELDPLPVWNSQNGHVRVYTGLNLATRETHCIMGFIAVAGNE